MQVTFALYPERHGAVWKTHLCHLAQPWPRLGPLLYLQRLGQADAQRSSMVVIKPNDFRRGEALN